MRAITVTGYGRPTDVLRSSDIPEPTLDDHHVLVSVHAAAINPADWHLVRGLPYLARLSVGLRRPGFQVAGSDFAGVVAAVGPEVTSVQPGDPVFGTTFMAGFGAFAEQVAVPEHLIAGKPAAVSYEEAAALPLAATTALQALRDHGTAGPGRSVLVIGASGGVGTYAVQLARHFGAEVTGVCSGANAELVRSLGARHVVDYTTEDITASAERYDLVLQLAGTHRASALRRLLTPSGTLLQLSGDSPNRWVGPLGRIIAGRLGAIGSRRTVTAFTVRPSRDDLELLATLAANGTVRTRIDSSHDLADAPAAIEQVESGHSRGKVVVRVARPATDPPQVPRHSEARRA